MPCHASLHALLILSDSALPLGSFAFSSGLESYLAHHKSLAPASPTPPSDFPLFLHLSLRNLASTALPYMLAAYRDPTLLHSLDNDIDASTPCTVARRASVAQGKALISLWSRAFAASCSANPGVDAVTAFTAALKQNKPDAFGLQLNAHFAPLFGVVCRALGVGEGEAMYLFLCNHGKSVLSAGVRAGVMGPYQAQGILMGEELQEVIRSCVDVEKEVEVEGAGVTVPTMDLWMGRHELLYSRIFNS